MYHVKPQWIDGTCYVTVTLDSDCATIEEATAAGLRWHAPHRAWIATPSGIEDMTALQARIETLAGRASTRHHIRTHARFAALGRSETAARLARVARSVMAHVVTARLEQFARGEAGVTPVMGLPTPPAMPTARTATPADWQAALSDALRDATL